MKTTMRSAIGRPRILVFSPTLSAVSGVSTHARLLFGSRLATEFDLLHFQVGGEGRSETALRTLWRLACTPFVLVGCIRRQHPAIAHLNTSMDGRAFWRDALYLAVAKLYRLKIVTQIHGGLLPDDFARSTLSRWLVRRSLEASDAIIVLSSVEQTAYARFCPQTRVQCIPNAIDPADVLPPTDRPRSEHPLRLVHVGRLVREKGVFEVLDAMACLLGTGHQLTLDIAGIGPDEAGMRAAVARLGLQASVQFHGPLFGLAKARLWTQSDVLAFPTYHPEGLPYALLEAMAAGVVPVTCPAGAIPDVLQDGVQGMLVPPRDVPRLAAAIAALDDDRALLEKMRVASRARVAERYGVEQLAAAFDQVYRTVLALPS